MRDGVTRTCDRIEKVTVEALLGVHLAGPVELLRPGEGMG